MSVTEHERRMVAERLRHLVAQAERRNARRVLSRALAKSDCARDLAHAVGINTVYRWSWADLYTRVAGLVEPGAERTCEMEWRESGDMAHEWRECSLCHVQVSTPMLVRYCPNCGARVREGR